MFKLFRSYSKRLLTCQGKKCAKVDSGECVEQCSSPCATLCDVEVGKCVCIRNYTGGCKQMRRRLLDLGLTPSTKVNVVQKAPFGDPIMLQVGDSNLSLSLSEASLLEVDRI